MEREVASWEGTRKGEVAGQEERCPWTSDGPNDGEVPDQRVLLIATESEVGEISFLHALNEQAAFLRMSESIPSRFDRGDRYPCLSPFV